MKKSLKNTLGFLTIALLATGANASSQGDFYIGANYQLDSFKEPGVETLKPQSIAANIGYYVSDHFSLQAAYAFSISDDSIDALIDVPLDFKVKDSLSVFLKAELPVTDDFALYTKVGASRIELELSAEYGGESFEESVSKSGASYGIGAQARVSDAVSIVLDYTGFAHDYYYDYNAVSIGLVKYF